MIWWISFLLGFSCGMAFLIVLAIVALVLDGKDNKRGLQNGKAR